MNELIKKLDPQRLGYSPKMSAIIGALLSHDYGVRDSHDGTLVAPFNITSDGFVIAGHTKHDTGAFVGTAEEFYRNICQLVKDANLTGTECDEFGKIMHDRVHRFQEEQTNA